MVRFPTFYLNLEGPDRSGKTTVFGEIHKKTGFRWNIHDRSAISMLAFSKFYNRDDFHNIENLKKELCNLNNRFIILYPSWETVYERQKIAPDEIHNVVNLKRVHSLFGDITKEFENYPNVFVVRCENPIELIEEITNSIIKTENASYKEIQQQVLLLAAASEGEAIGVNFTLFDNGKFLGIDKEVLDYPKEKEYYEKIRENLRNKIEKEMSEGQTKHSRRFIYSDDSCISLANFNYRKNELDCNIVLRSSDVVGTLYYDLNFAMILCQDVFNLLDLKPERDFCRVRFEINSAHIPSIVNKEK